jgi:phage shock protein C
MKIDPSRPLRRSTRDAMIGGVCAGIARWLGMDVTTVRVLYVVVSFLSVAFPGLLVYIICWLIVPPDELES